MSTVVVRYHAQSVGFNAALPASQDYLASALATQIPSPVGQVIAQITLDQSGSLTINSSDFNVAAAISAAITYNTINASDVGTVMLEGMTTYTPAIVITIMNALSIPGLIFFRDI